jgi:hypothetical protein
MSEDQSRSENRAAILIAVVTVAMAFLIAWIDHILKIS